METKATLIQRIYRGRTIYGYSEQDIQRIIERIEHEEAIFYRSSVYTFSCYAKLLKDNSVELTKFYNNGEEMKVLTYKNKDEFWKNIS